MLRRKGVECNVLNAKYHEQEAEIIKDAGQEAQVTIATNMAGRGTDIKLGEGVARNGGLHIIGTERHESRRIDNQLRGRSGRQGDPGSSRFYISLEDEVMRLFGGERMTNIMDRVGFTDEQPIESGLVSKSIERAQSKVENHNYEIRKHVLEYDDVMNKQRSVIYGDRRAILEGKLRFADVHDADARRESGRSGRTECAGERASERVGSRRDARRAGADFPDQARASVDRSGEQRSRRDSPHAARESATKRTRRRRRK